MFGFTWRVFAVTAALVGTVVLVALLVASDSVRRASDRTAQRSLEQSADLVAQFLAGRERSLVGGARVFVQGPYFRTLVSERRRADILDQTVEAAAQLESQWVFITDALGVLLAQSDEPRAGGEDMSAVPLIAGALHGRVTTGFGVSSDSLLFQAVAVPIAIPGGASIGVLVATRLVDSLLAHDVKVATASELVFFTRDVQGGVHVAASTLGHDDALQRTVRELSMRTAVADAGSRAPDVRVNDVDYRAQRSALTTAGGDVVGGFVVLRSRDAERASLADVRRSLAVAGAFGFVLALLVAWLAARRVARPVRTLARAVRRAADGNYDLAIRREVSGSAADAEVDELADAVDALLADLRDKEALIAMSVRAVSGDEVARAVPDAAEPSRSGRRLRRHRAIGESLSDAPSVSGDVELRLGTHTGIVIAPGALLANRYRIEALLGSGGMGMVYRAIDRAIGETVAVKLLRPEVVAGDPDAFERVKNELRLARRITHRNVVRTHDIGESDGVPFLTMEYVDGSSLAAVIQARGALPPSAVIAIAKQVLRALAAAHEQEVVHGDLKPQNLLIGPNGVVKVTDFGVARLIRDPRRSGHGAGRGEFAAGRVVGATLGTPEYMAPEQLIGGDASVLTDIYAAGIVIHECLTGVTPYRADTPMAFFAHKLVPPTPPTAIDANVQLRMTHQRSEAAGEPLSSARYSGALERLIASMTSADPSTRSNSADQLLRAFARLA